MEDEFPYFLLHVCFQMLTSRLARRDVETLSLIRRSLFLFVTPMEAGLRFNVTTHPDIVGVWTAREMRSLVLEVLIWKNVQTSVCIIVIPP